MKIILVLFPGFIAIAICYFVVVAAAFFFFLSLVNYLEYFWKVCVLYCIQSLMSLLNYLSRQ